MHKTVALDEGHLVCQRINADTKASEVAFQWLAKPWAAPDSLGRIFDLQSSVGVISFHKGFKKRNDVCAPCMIP